MRFKRMFRDHLAYDRVPLKNTIEYQNIDFNSTVAINIALCGALSALLFIIPQTKVMIHDYLASATKPLITVLYLCMISFTFYGCSRFATIRRYYFNKEKQGIEVGRKKAYSKDGIIVSTTYIFPLLLATYIVVQSWSNAGNFLLNLACIAILLIFTFVFLMYVLQAPNYSESSDNKKRIDGFVRKLSFLNLALVILYALGTHLWPQWFTGTIGISPFDITLVIIMTIRILFSLIYYLYANSPTFDSLIKNSIHSHPAKNLNSLIGLIILIVFLFVTTLSPFDGNHNFKKIQTATLNAENIERIGLREYIEGWLLKRKTDRNPIYLLAGQGGGSRAGFWTGSILATLDTMSKVSFYDNCLAISTVSGSSVGAGLFVSAKRSQIDINSNGETLINGMKKFFNKDFFSSSLMRLFYFNPIQRGLCLFRRTNRNDQLMIEEASAFKYDFGLDSCSMCYDTQFPIVTKKTVKIDYDHPLFLPNTYNVSKKLRSVISPVQLIDKARDNDALVPYEDLLATMIASNKSISIAQAVNLSQMFPVMSASAVWNSCEYFDGGAYDNSGLSTVRDIYSTLVPLRDKISPDKEIIVIYAKNSSEASTPGPHRTAVGTLASAALGSIFNASEIRHVSKLSSEVNKLGDRYLELSLDTPIVLNRWLSKTMIDTMTQELVKGIESIKEDLLGRMARVPTPAHHQLTIHFEFGESSLTDRAQAKLDELVNSIEPRGIILHGYTDNIGNSQRNKLLAAARIEAVEKYILNRGNISREEINRDTVGMQPGDDDYSRHLNRCVEVEFDSYIVRKRYYPAGK